MKTEAKDLFARAHELEGEEREAFLAKACKDSAELRLEVQRLLVQAEKADSFFGDTEGATIGAEEFDTTYTEIEGDVVGPYTLRQQIGEGGFGTVWMAEQSVPISRMVALKVIKAGMDTKQVLARFEAERQAVAMMDHPNIAKVLDAGATSTGRPYFAMELVKGIPITQFCDQQKFGPRRRLELFKDVCSAVQHAHQKGIIHRDLKPSNIMVTLAADAPVVKVIDFGIAKATQNKLTDKTLFTRFEQFLGTPVYMSPEQAAMSAIDIDTRSDIYSLGVLLYELLAGAPPFDQKSLLSAGYDEMRRIIAEDEPLKPSTRCTQTRANPATKTGSQGRKVALNPTTLKGDLDWIVMKAIEKDRTRRYETANAFAADIGRYLSDEPVLAAAPGAGYKFKKFARRNKAAFTVAAAMLVLLLVGIATTSWQAVRATAEQKLAEEERDRANTAEQLAAKRLTESEKAREEAEAVSDFMVEVFQSPDPTRGGRTITVAETLEKAAERLETDLVDQPGRRAKLQFFLGRTYFLLGLYREAIPLLESCRTYVLKVHGAEDPKTIASMIHLASAYAKVDRQDEAIEMFKEVLELCRRKLGPKHPETLNAANNLATAFFDAGRWGEALEMFENLLELRREIPVSDDDEVFTALNNLAASLLTVGRPAEALKMQEEALAYCRKKLDPEHPDTLMAMHGLASSLYAVGRRAEALKMQEAALVRFRKVHGTEHPSTHGAMENLAGTYHYFGRLDEAIKLLEELLPPRRKLSPEHPKTLGAMTNLAIYYADVGRFEEALKLQEEALALKRRILPPSHPFVVTAINHLANLYIHAGRLDESLKLREEQLELTEALGPDHPDTLAAMTNLAINYGNSGRFEEALKLQEKALVLKRRVLPPSHPFVSVALNHLADLYSQAGRWDESLKLREEQLELTETLGAEHPNTLVAMTSLAFGYHDAGRHPEAIEVGKSCLNLHVKVFGGENQKTLNAMTNLAIFYQAADRLEEAIVLEGKSLALKRRILPAGHPMTVESMDNLATCYEKANRKEEAKPLRAELTKLKEDAAKTTPPTE